MNDSRVRTDAAISFATAIAVIAEHSEIIADRLSIKAKVEFQRLLALSFAAAVFSPTTVFMVNGKKQNLRLSAALALSAIFKNRRNTMSFTRTARIPSSRGESDLPVLICPIIFPVPLAILFGR
jgi:hypothetical protein